MIRHAVSGDCLNLAALSFQVWMHAYAREGVRREISQYVFENFTEAQFQTLLEKPDYHILVCEEEGHLLGYVAIDLTAQFESPDNGFEIDTLYVQEHFQGKGLGRQLLQAVGREFGSRYWLATWIGNTEAIGFYHKLGFEDIGSRFFQLGEEQHENKVLAFKG